MPDEFSMLQEVLRQMSQWADVEAYEETSDGTCGFHVFQMGANRYIHDRRGLHVTHKLYNEESGVEVSYDSYRGQPETSLKIRGTRSGLSRLFETIVETARQRERIAIPQPRQSEVPYFNRYGVA